MKLNIACLLPIIVIANSNMEVMEIDHGNRFLADRAVTRSELATHTDYEGGLWTSLGGIVYDLTDFMHPGGTRILRVGGIEGDSLYLEAYDEGDHPFTLAEVVSQPGILRIGPLQSDSPTTVPTATPTTAAPANAPTATPTSEPTSPVLVATTSPTIAAPANAPIATPITTPIATPIAAPISPVLVATAAPTRAPTAAPTTAPATVKTAAPSNAPTNDASTDSPATPPTNGMGKGGSISNDGKKGDGKKGGKKSYDGKKSGKKSGGMGKRGGGRRDIYLMRGRTARDAFD